MSFSSWRELVAAPAAERHIVQLYRDPAFMHRAVALWAAEPLRAGGSAVLIGEPEKTAGILATLARLDLDPAAREREGRLVVVGADDLLARFMRDGTPHGPTFARLATDLIARARNAGDPRVPLRAWGEMVDLLRQRGNPAAAKSLEAHWNEVLDDRAHLLCSYRADNLSPETHSGPLADMCAGHSQLIPEEDEERFESAVSRALADVFGEEDARTVRALFGTRRTVPVGMPGSEAVLVALHELQPQLGKRVLRATRAHLESAAPA